jgi:hypothetical protein
MSTSGKGRFGVIFIKNLPKVSTSVFGKLFLNPKVISRGPVYPTGNFIACYIGWSLIYLM